MSALVQVSQARKLLAEAKDVRGFFVAKVAADAALGALKNLRKVSEDAAAAYLDAWEVQQRAQRAIGEHTRAMEHHPTGGGRPSKSKTGNNALPVSKREQLEQVGLTKMQANRAEGLAALSSDDFEKRLEKRRAVVDKQGDSKQLLAKTAASGHDGDAWGTPAEWVDPARELCGGFDLDPASNARAANIVKAEKYFTKEQDARKQDWGKPNSMWMNPPFSSPLISELVGLYLELVRKRGELKAWRGACLLTNNASETDWWQSAAKACTAHLAPDERIAFLDANNEPVNDNRQGQTLFYFGPKLPRFYELYGGRGVVSVVYRP